MYFICFKDKNEQGIYLLMLIIFFDKIQFKMLFNQIAVARNLVFRNNFIWLSYESQLNKTSFSVKYKQLWENIMILIQAKYPIMVLFILWL